MTQFQLEYVGMQPYGPPCAVADVSVHVMVFMSL
jgi:hypothetical protein